MDNEIRLSVDQATAIIAEAKNDGAFTDPMPVDENERVQHAIALYNSAVNAVRVGVTAPVVHAVIAIASGDEPPFDTPPAEEGVLPESEKPSGPRLVIDEESAEAGSSDEIDFVVEKPATEEPPKRKARASKKKEPVKLPIDDFLAKERLPVPPEVDWEITPIPPDLSILSDNEIRRMHSEYHAYFARTAWILALEENDHNAAEHMYNIAFARAIKAIGGEKITAAKSEAGSDAEVVSWKEKVLEHGANVRKLKALSSIYDSTCNRLSREWTMRSEERGTSGNLYTR